MWCSFKGDNKSVCWRALLGSKMWIYRIIQAPAGIKKRKKHLSSLLGLEYRGSWIPEALTWPRSKHWTHWNKEERVSRSSCSVFACFSAQHPKLDGRCYLSSLWEQFGITLLWIKNCKATQTKGTSHLCELLFSPPGWSLVYHCMVHRLDPMPWWIINHLVTIK